MANSYEWNCKTCDVYPEYEDEQDVVVVVHWRLNATSSETHEVNGEDVPYTASVYGTETLTFSSTSRILVETIKKNNSIKTISGKDAVDIAGVPF